MPNLPAKKYKKNLLLIGLASLLLLFLLVVALKKYIATPHAASHVSAMLSHALGQPVVIESIDIHDGALHLKRLSLADPEGFSSSKMLSIGSITVEPVWVKLLSDKRVFEKIRVEDITVDLHRNSKGIWNFHKLQKRFSSSKPSTGELLVRDLQIANGTLQINDHKLGGLSLKVLNLATKGSEKTGFNLDFEDQGRNRYAVSGKARLGQDPELDATLSSSPISLKSLSEVLKVKNNYLPEQGTADIRLSAYMHKGMLKVKAKTGITAVAMPALKTHEAFSGTISLTAAYDLQKDHLTVENLALHLNQLLALKASGSVRDLKRSKQFVVDVGTDEIDVGAIAGLIPELKKNRIVIRGTLKKSSLHLAGNAAAGITSATGNTGYSNGSLVHDWKPVFNDLAVNVTVSGKGNVLTASGKAMQAQSQEKQMLEMLDAPFRVTFDRLLKTVRLESSNLSARAQGAEFRGKLSYLDGTALVENAVIKAKDASVTLERLSARIPKKQATMSTVRYPVSADLSGLTIRRGDALLKNLGGSIRGTYAVDLKERWLEGTAVLAAEKAGWQEKEAGASAVQAVFSRSGGKAVFKASLLGGLIEGNAAFNPFALQEKTDFKVNAKGVRLAGIMKFAGVRGDTELSGGTLDGSCNGSYSRSMGLYCDLEAIGRDIALTGKGGKTLVSAAGITIDSKLSGQKLVINQAGLTVGNDVAVKVAGTVENTFLPARQGKIAFTVPDTSLAAVADSFLNMLPRSIQEATIKGNIGAEGAVNLQKGKVLVDGAVTLAHVSIDAPTEKIQVSDINGLLPLSFDFSGKTVAFKSKPTSGFSRQNYDALLKQLRQPRERGEIITVGSSSFGGLGIDSLKLELKAANGITEIVSLDTSLYGGAMLGRGFITVQDGIFYRGDMLFNGLSMLQLCKAFPGITGYISGKVDGIVSFQGTGRKLSDITGFSELWARAAKDEKMLVSREFLQRLSGKKLSGFFFSSDRSYDHAGIKAGLENGYLTFDALDISNTNFLGIRDLSVTIAPSQNRIAIDHLLNSIKEAAVRGKNAAGTASEGENAPVAAPPATEFKWDE